MQESYRPPDESWYLTGPTASGKTAVALELAPRINAEIISLDSMAVYRGMDIGTAKPSAAEQAAVPHHLLDLVDPHEEYSLAKYIDDVERAVRAIQAHGKRPLFVGGTPLYLKALLRGIFAGPEADWELRRRLTDLAEREGNTALHRQLAAVDPISAARLHEQDVRRVIRALEVHEKTGQTLSSLQQQFERARPATACRVFCLQWPRDALHDRIDRRVDAMFEGGLVDEAAGILNRQPPPGRTASQAVGYREVFEHLAGERSREETMALVKLRTRQFAKRQMTWFRSLGECRPIEGGHSPIILAETISQFS